MVEILEKSTPQQVFVNVVLFLFLILQLYGQFNRNHPVPEWKRIIIILGILFFCLFPYWGNDYWHYMYDFHQIKKGGLTNLEDIYYDIIGDYMPSYFIFRLSIWGSALVFMYKIFKIESLNFGMVTLIFVATFLPLFSYARATLPMTMMYLGVSIIYSQGSKQMIRLVIGFALIITSLPFHKSAIFGVISIILASIARYKTKYLILAVIVSIPFMISFLENYSQDFLLLDGGDNLVVQTGQNYLLSESNKMGIAAQIYAFIQRIPFVGMLILFLYLIKTDKLKQLPRSVVIFSIISAIEIFASFLLLILNTELNISAISYRFAYFAWIPSIVLLTYCKTISIAPKIVNFCIVSGFFTSAYAVVYAWYNAF